MTKTPETTKAPATRSNDTEEDVTKLAHVPDPAKLSDKKIKEISGDDGTDDPENAANQDVAETLKNNRDAAKAGEPLKHGGGFSGEPG